MKNPQTSEIKKIPPAFTSVWALSLAFVLLFILIFIAPALSAQHSPQPVQDPNDPLLGVWQGTMQTKIGPIEVYFTIEPKGSGAYLAKVTIPAQKVREMPMQEVRFAAPDVVLDMSSYGIVFEGRLAPDSASIGGQFKVGEDTMDLELHRSSGVPESGRPQEPKKPYPYEEIEVRFPNLEAGIHLAGTLTLPSGPGPFPAAALVSGSGPHDRDSTIAGHRPFLVWADSLTRRGVAVLRCDDRGVGKSEGDFHQATTADFASDAQAAWEFLKSQPRIDGHRIGFIGHSEGGIIAPMVAARNPEVAFLVLLAGTGIPGDRLAILQGEAVSRSRGAGPEAVRKETGMNERMFQVIINSETAQAAEADLKRIIAETLADMSDSERKELNVSEDSLLTDFKGILADYPWARFVLGYDPAIALRKVRCPVLALVGDKDTQVPADVNLAAIEQALQEAGNSRYEVKKLPGLNHLFQTAQTGHPREYARIEETISPQVLQMVGDWILQSKQAFQTGDHDDTSYP
jgi:pimeloyl-ACP methyl ester carboxylesterase